MLESKTTMSHPKLTNPCSYVKSIEISSDPNYDLNVTQPISIRRSKKLHELREKLSNYTSMSIQLLEGRDHFSLLVNLQSKYQTSYNHSLYGAWSSSLPVHDVGIEFSFSGNILWLRNLILMPQILGCLSFHMYLFLPNSLYHLCHFTVLFIIGLITWIFLNTSISFLL